MSSRVVALRERGKEAERKGEKKAGRKKGGEREEGGGGRGINTMIMQQFNSKFIRIHPSLSGLSSS